MRSCKEIQPRSKLQVPVRFKRKEVATNILYEDERPMFDEKEMMI